MNTSWAFLFFGRESVVYLANEMAVSVMLISVKVFMLVLLSQSSKKANNMSLSKSSSKKSPFKKWILSGSQLSPFHLKVAALLTFKGIAFDDYPSAGGFLANLKVSIRVLLLKAGRLKLTYPAFTRLDEFPLVPFLFGPKGENLYDSSSIAVWLDQNITSQRAAVVRVSTDPKINFLVQLVDEYFDEFGLYMVHHARWKMSAQDNTAGMRLATEMSSIIGPLKNIVAKGFSARQVRRCPYLFSVAPQGYKVDGLAQDRQVPARSGFPATHDFLEKSYHNILHALESILASRSYLFGERFTLADASLYGQLGMNLTDPTAANWIKEQAPNVYEWLLKIHKGDYGAHNDNAQLKPDETLKPLLDEISRTYYPLMKLNEAAYEEHKAGGETVFNEKAFWKRKSLYSGKVDGHPFTSVVKTFQVKTWRNIKACWQGLDQDDQTDLTNTFPGIKPI